jgi:HAD superfamily hydrolase (TIGR01509 family)
MKDKKTTIMSDFARVIIFSQEKNISSLSSLFSNRENTFESKYTFNDELLDFYKNMKEKHSLNLYVFTSSSKDMMREGIVQNKLKFFDEIITSSMLFQNPSKSTTKAYELLLKKINKSAEECIFVDDDMDRINAADESGITSIQHISNDKTKSKIKNYF